MTNSNRAPSWTMFLVAVVASIIASVSVTLGVMLFFFDAGRPPASNLDQRPLESSSELVALTQRVAELESAAKASPARTRQADEIAVSPSKPTPVQSTNLPTEPKDPSITDRLSSSRGETMALLMKMRQSGSSQEQLALARQILADSESAGWWMAVRVLLESEPAEALTHLRAKAQSADSSGAGMWEHSFQTLSQSPGISLSSELPAFYEWGDLSVKSAAARTLNRHGDESLMQQFVAEVAQRIQSQEPKERQEAMEQLPYLDAEHGQGLVLPLLRDEDPEIRLRALSAIPRFDLPNGLSILEGLTSDPDSRVKDRATRLLESLRQRQRIREQSSAQRAGR